MSLQAFLCHSSADAGFVTRVAGQLSRHLEVFCFEAHHRAEPFTETVNEALGAADAWIVFWGQRSPASPHQRQEIGAITARKAREPQRRVVIVALDGSAAAQDLPKGQFALLDGLPFIAATQMSPAACARAIVLELGLVWKPHGLPSNPHLFSYEKNIIEFFAATKALGGGLHEPGGEPKEEKRRAILRRMLRQGCPPDWPTVVDLTSGVETLHTNRLQPQDIGAFRSRDARVSATALSAYAEGCRDLTFPEAGPRAELFFPVSKKSLNVGILVSGGIAPGINAVIDGIVQRHWMYAGRHQERHRLAIRGYRDGFYAFKAGVTNHYYPLLPDPSYRTQDDEPVRPIHTSELASRGGSILATSRTEELLLSDSRDKTLQAINDRLRTQGIDILYVIGGDGSMRAAHALWNVARADPERTDPLSVVAIPKTMDNDILWVWQSFGFLSAVEKARETIDLLHTEVNSNPRICVLQLFGSDSGFVVSHAVVASSAGNCDVALIPEVPFSMIGLARHLKSRICRRARLIPDSLIVMAETAIPLDVMCYAARDRDALSELRDLTPKERAAIDRFDPEELGLSREERRALGEFTELRDAGQRIEGQTSDALRRAGLKIVTAVLPRLLPEARVGQHGDPNWEPEWRNLRIFANEPRHLLRAIPPSTADIIMAQRLGSLAVDNAMAGYTDFMISQWLTEFVLVPLELVVLGRKRIPQRGIFWKSVLAKTGQPHDLAAPWRNAEPVRASGGRRRDDAAPEREEGGEL